MIAGLISDLLGSARPAVRAIRNASIENPAVSLNDPKTWEAFGVQPSSSGVSVTHDTALNLGAVWQAVWMISGDMAGLTLNVFKRLPEDDRQIDRAHPAEVLVSMRANEETSAWEFWRRLMAHALLWGNGYAYIERAGGRRGKPAAIYNLLPDRTCPQWDDNIGLYYETWTDGKKELLFRDEVLHVKGLSVENGLGLDLVEHARDTIGIALAVDEYLGQFYKEGAQSGGVLTVPFTSEQGTKKFEEGFSKRYNDKSTRFKVAILRDGAKFEQTSIDAQKSQQHELRADQTTAVAQYFNVAPYKLGVTDSATPAKTAEEAQRVYLSSCLNIWRNAIATECQLKLLTEEQIVNDTHYFEHNTTNFIEMDPAALTDMLVKQRGAELINRDEGRRKLNLPKSKGAGGDDYTNPNVKSGASGTEEEPAEATGETKDAGTSKEAAKTGNVQATALNGAQISSLLLVVQDVAAKRMPPESGKAMLQASFPLTDVSLIEAIISPLANFEAPVAPVPDEEEEVQETEE